MSKFLWAIVCSAALTLAAGEDVAAQTTAGRGPDSSVVRDPELEKDSEHNLEVARHYFKLKKAYRAALARCEEIIAGNPNYSRVDEALYIAGVSSLRLSENRGKQAAQISAEQLRDDARQYLSRVVNEFPDSEFKSDAAENLRVLGGAGGGATAKPKEPAKQSQ